ncbi:MAG: transposase, partial [Sandaracinaceae bacterium]
MRSLNEHMARRANREDGCRGRFWEGRFKSQPLLDEAALLTCMSYVDLNPVRAGLSRGLEDSEFTSTHERLRAAEARLDEAESTVAPRSPVEPARADDELSTVEPGALVPFEGEPGPMGDETRLPMTFADYVELLDWTGRASRPGKPVRVRGAPPALLVRRRIDPEAWLRTMRGPGLDHLGALGSPAELDALAEQRG